MAEYRVDGFTFFASFHELSKELSDEQYAIFFRAVSDYVFDGEEPQLDGLMKAAFEGVRPNLDLSIQKRMAGKKGGRPKTKEVKTKNESGLNRADTGKTQKTEEPKKSKKPKVVLSNRIEKNRIEENRREKNRTEENRTEQENLFLSSERKPSLNQGKNKNELDFEFQDFCKFYPDDSSPQLYDALIAEWQKDPSKTPLSGFIMESMDRITEGA